MFRLQSTQVDVSVQDRHVNEANLKTAATKRLQQAPGAASPPPSAPPVLPTAVYPPNAALQAIRRFSARPPFPEMLVGYGSFIASCVCAIISEFFVKRHANDCLLILRCHKCWFDPRLKWLLCKDPEQIIDVQLLSRQWTSCSDMSLYKYLYVKNNLIVNFNNLDVKFHSRRIIS